MRRHLDLGIAWLLLAAAWLSPTAPAQEDPAEHERFAAVGFEKSHALIPMRDGIRLYTVIVRPISATQPLPILLSRTPYNAEVTGASLAGWVTNHLKELVADGYVFVRQDLRGKGRSEGRFAMMRPLARPGADSIDESTDTYDTIAWLLANLPGHNGKVGLYGTSYLGWTTLMGTLNPHPALRAACEEAAAADMFLGDDFHHNGAFRLSYAYEYAVSLESARTNVSVRLDRADAYDWYLGLGPLRNVNLQRLHGQIPSWNDFVDHPNFDAFWQRRALPLLLGEPGVPVLHVAGWWDQEDFYGPVACYRTLEEHDRQRHNYLVCGPWNHGGWNSGDGRHLGPLDFGRPTGIDYRARFRAAWFARYLHDRPVPPFAEATTFQTGANAWEEHADWPPRLGVTHTPLYLHAAGRLDFTPPPARPSGAADAFVSDPARPVPYRSRPIEPTYGSRSRWSTWLLEDQRFVDNRPDVLTYQTAPLEADLVVTGEIEARLEASTTGTDADWIVKLIDVYPEDYEADSKLAGYQLMVANEVFRARFRRSFERPEPVPAGKVLSYRFSLRYANHRFLKGHRIMVQIQSTWFPIIDRNPQTFVPNIFAAPETAFRPATHRIFRSGKHASHINLPVRTPSPPIPASVTRVD
jgi:putative CocE/NonD family hydrolase